MLKEKDFNSIPLLSGRRGYNLAISIKTLLMEVNPFLAAPIIYTLLSYFGSKGYKLTKLKLGTFHLN